MPVLTYPTLITPAHGQSLGATQLNGLVRAVEYLHGIAAASYEPFTGAYLDDGNTEIWRSYYIYRGITRIFCDIRRTDGTLSVLHSHNSGETEIATDTVTTGIDLASISANLTSGTKYYVRVVVGGTGQARVNYVGAPVSNDVTWITPTTFTDGNVSAAADFSTDITDASYLKKLLEVPRGTFRSQTGTTPGGGSTLTLFTGSFIYRGLNTLSAYLRTISTVDTLAISISDLSGSNVRSVWSQASASGYYTVSADISGLSPALAIGTRYRLYVTAVTASGTVLCYLNRLRITGSKALTSIPQRWEPGNYGYASSGANRLQYISQSLTDIKTITPFETISSVDYGIQELAVNNSNMTGKQEFQDFRRIRQHRWLMYLPTASEASGTLTYGDATESLPDNQGDGSWATFDLETLPLLPIGFTYKVTAVKACFESPTSS